jgi:transketolase
MPTKTPASAATDLLPRPNGDALRVQELRRLARACVDVRRKTLTTIREAGSGHPGGSLSATEVLVALYGAVLRHRPTEPEWPDRDRFVLSKGHACPAHYTVLARHGYFPESELGGFRRIGRLLQGLPSPTTPGIECASGSLGQGFSAALGMAVGLWLSGRREPRVYALVGDGELQEGQSWEVILAAGHRCQSNLTVFVDANGLQQDGPIADTLEVEPLAAKWRAFGWAVREIDGHDLGAILGAAEWAATVEGSPQVVIAHTVKGRGVSFMEGVPRWHETQPLTDEELARALAELDEEEAKLS